MGDDINEGILRVGGDEGGSRGLQVIVLIRLRGVS